MSHFSIGIFRWFSDPETATRGFALLEIQIGERSGSLLALSRSMCQCGDPECDGMVLGFEMFFSGFLEDRS